MNVNEISEGGVVGTIDDRGMIEQILQTELRWTRAHVELDLETIAGILSDGYRQIRLDGSLIGKTELLDSYRSGARRWQIAQSSKHEVSIRGETAIVIGHWRGKGENDGEPFDYCARFVSIYVLETGNWKLLFDTSIPLPD
jgi:ketosteroid isomerase-like protein